MKGKDAWNYSFLQWRFLFIYFVISSVSAIGIRLSNIYISGNSHELNAYNIQAVTALFFVWIISLQSFTLWQLGANTRNQASQWKRYVTFPSRLFWFALTMNMLSCVGYTYFQYKAFNLRPFSWDQPEALQLLLRGTLLSPTLGLLVAIGYYSLARWNVRPHLMQSSGNEMETFRFKSISNKLIVAFTSLMVIVAVRFCWYVYKAQLEAREVKLSLLLIIIVLAFLIGMAMFYVLLFGFRNEIQSTIRSIRSLLNGGWEQLRRPIPIITDDEVGELAVVYNKVLEKTRDHYEHLQEEKQLAAAILKKLFPEKSIQHQGWRVTTTLSVDTDSGLFCDLYEQEGIGIFVWYGAIQAKGMSAALIQSAMAAQFRSEIQRTDDIVVLMDRLHLFYRETFDPAAGSTYALLKLSSANPSLECFGYVLYDPLVQSAADTSLSNGSGGGSSQVSIKLQGTAGATWTLVGGISAAAPLAKIEYVGE